MMQRSVTHTSFVVTRGLAAPPTAVFRAWSEPEAKRRWSACHAGTEHRLDFRVGGAETSRVAMPDGADYVVEARFLDIVEDVRILYAYSMRKGDTRLSASLVTVLFEPDGAGTRMVFTEQVAFLDGHQDPAERIRGTEEGLDRLRLELSGAM
ncbi:SRPBCC family protein [Plastoroseomonas hellenica]|uniref:ATPase n=1 Tax=Plastoroseomonas hellenica TaxID=2687306 RepID=A0ABS5F9W0_9PROT|nr:SRPBCC family protein [Plastoroseomonas hellenica]MBR0647545.1 ATPase [Plastoroseomonas hellenica]MBR0669349.1 ATPase [Plastoroseomonas hellenica]